MSSFICMNTEDLRCGIETSCMSIPFEGPVLVSEVGFLWVLEATVSHRQNSFSFQVSKLTVAVFFRAHYVQLKFDNTTAGQC